MANVPLRQPGHHDTGAVGASLVGDLELVTALGKDRSLVQGVERAQDRPAASIRDDFEAAAHRRLEAED